jgi:hypothetical protein
MEFTVQVPDDLASGSVLEAGTRLDGFLKIGRAVGEED